MPTLEFKPMGSRAKGTPIDLNNMRALIAQKRDVNDIIFTYERNQVPVQLGQVPHNIWMQTYDAVKAKIAESMEGEHKSNQQKMKMIPTNPCCMLPCCLICCCCCQPKRPSIFELMNQQQQRMQLDRQCWISLVQSQKVMYAPYNIDVQLLEVTQIHGGGNQNVHQTVNTVGLKFEIVGGMLPSLPVVQATSINDVNVVVPMDVQMTRNTIGNAFCTQCGKEYSIGSKFCSGCGQKN